MKREGPGLGLRGLKNDIGCFYFCVFFDGFLVLFTFFSLILHDFDDVPQLSCDFAASHAVFSRMVLFNTCHFYKLWAFFLQVKQVPG